MNEEAQKQISDIMNSIESQVMDKSGNTRFVYALFIVVGISIIFEYFVRKYKAEIREKKEKEESYGSVRKKLWIAYGIHFVFMFVLALILKYAVLLTDIYTGFLIAATFYVVEFAPLFNWKLFKRKKGDE